MTAHVPDSRLSRHLWRPVAAALAVVLIAALFVWRVMHPGEEEPAGAIESQAARTALQEGRLTVVMDSAARARAGIVVTVLRATPFRRRERAYGEVVSVEALGAAGVRSSEAHARAEQARITEETAGHERDRVRVLYAEGRNVARKVLERAEADWAVAHAEARAAAASERSERSRVEERWGPVLGGWIRQGAGVIERVLERRDVLVEVTLPPDAAFDTPPDTVSVSVGSGPAVEARFVSLAPRSDPRIQGATLFYLAPAAPDLVPGRSVVASIPLGDPVEAVIVPRAAVVWAEGGAWVYVARGADGFVRRRIPTDAPTEDGYALTQLPGGTRVVSAGAQILLSEEYRAQIEVGEEGG